MSHPETHFEISQSDCRLVVVQDRFQPCPYLEGVVARMPLYLPVGRVTPEVTDELLAKGYRRSGEFLYHTQCPTCQQCMPTRIPLRDFHPTKSMRRVANRGDRDLCFQWNSPTVDSRRIEMFNQHRNGRDLNLDGEQVDAESYRSFLVDCCGNALELAVYLQDQLVAISIVDVGRQATSAVYTHFDPVADRYSLGTYAILKHIQWAVDHGKQYVYLGMYVAANQHLNYKARFRPQQRLVEGNWIAVEETASV